MKTVTHYQYIKKYVRKKKLRGKNIVKINTYKYKLKINTYKYIKFEGKIIDPHSCTKVLLQSSPGGALGPVADL